MSDEKLPRKSPPNFVMPKLPEAEEQKMTDTNLPPKLSLASLLAKLPDANAPKNIFSFSQMPTGASVSQRRVHHQTKRQKAIEMARNRTMQSLNVGRGKLQSSINCDEWILRSNPDYKRLLKNKAELKIYDLAIKIREDAERRLREDDQYWI
jgi:hypothetical protein